MLRLMPASAPRRDSYIRMRRVIMLVRIERGEEPEELLRLNEECQLLRVRYALPACERMRITRPLVVVLGPNVREWDVVHLERTATEIDATMIQLGPMIVPGSLQGWLTEAMEESQRLRTAGARVTTDRT